MTNKIQVTSIIILNSKYRIFFNLVVYLIIYFFFYIEIFNNFNHNENITECMPSGGGWINKNTDLWKKNYENLTKERFLPRNPRTPLWNTFDEPLYKLLFECEQEIPYLRDFYNRNNGPSCHTANVHENINREIRKIIDNYLLDTIQLKEEHERLIVENKELQNRNSILEASNLALNQKLITDIAEPKDTIIEQLRKQVRDLRIEQSLAHVTSLVEEKEPIISEEKTRQISETARPLFTRSEKGLYSSFYKTKLITVLNEKQEAINRLTVAEEQIVKLTQEKTANTAVFRQETNSLYQTIVGLHQENQELQSQLKTLEERVKELSRDRYPGAQRVNPFSTLKK